MSTNEEHLHELHLLKIKPYCETVTYHKNTDKLYKLYIHWSI